MASTSASSTQKSFKYDVFLSFRGEDTRKNFVDHLYHALQQKGIVTCKDDEEIKRGKRISDELTRSIEESKFYIIVFSKNYASSSWCLDELVKIIECQKTSEHTAYPVFYDVEPNEVRKQSGAVGEAFAKHREEEAAWKWREALRKAADLSGWELKTTLNGHEAKFIQKIVEEISTGIRYISSSFDGKLIGMEMRVNDVVSSLETDIDDVRMIGIKGIGGGGKTTLAKAVFDQLFVLFDGSSFIENVREFSKASPCGLKSLQKQVLSDVLNDTPIAVHGFSDLKNVMKKIMYGRKVLIVLDDVDHIDQLEALAGELNWFKPGSRIIITTRDEQVLIAHGVPQNLILDVNLLSQEEANCLFNSYAFGRVIPNQGYEELAYQVIRYGAGLPLTIKVLGSFLRKKSKLEWSDAIERLKKVPLKTTLDILEISYNSLEEDYKEIFLDVTCMLKGWKKEEAIIALESCGFHARSGLKVLELKSLLTVSDSECIGMHDHIEEMGQNIVRRLQPNEPNKHSRLWIKEEINDILVEDKGTEATRCMKVRMVDPVIVMKGLQKMKELRFLDVMWRGKLGSNSPDINVESDFNNQRFSKLDFADLDYIDVGKDNLYLPNGLLYMRWNGYPFTRLPKNFQANNLVGLKMHFSNINQLWEKGERKVPKKLRFIDLSFCKLRSLDIGLIPNLERLNLINCDKLVELHMPVENSKLIHLDLYGTELRTLDLEQAQNLDTLKVQVCRYLTELRMPIESLKLKHLTVQCSMLKTLNLTQTRNLKTLNLAIEHLVELHMPAENYKLKFLNLISFKIRTLVIGRAQHLNNLNIKDNGDLAELHIPVEKLKRLRLRCSKMKTLNLMWTQNLNTLDLSECVDLLEVHMPIESLELETIKISCSKLTTLNLTNTRNIKRLDLEQCGDLLELHMPIESPGLKIINICFSKLRTINLTGTRNLERLVLEQCEDLVELHVPIESPKLKTINIRYCKLRTLNLAGSKNLENLDLEHCEDLVELHMPIESPKLKTIKIRYTKLRTVYLGLSPNLECLDLHDCFKLVEIHAPVGCQSGCVTVKPVSVNPEVPVGSLAELYLMARPIGICPLHPKNDLPKFHFECTYKELILSLSLNLVKLISFSLCSCTNLASLSGIICCLQLRKITLEGSIPEVPKELDQLECLEELSLISTNIQHLPDSICTLKHLKLLQLKSCWFLKQLPEDIGRLECLEELRLTDCTSLRDIPNSICEMKRLKCFHLTNCILVKKLPKEIGRLKCLKELNIEGTGIRDFPASVFQLEDLLFLF